MSEKLEKLKRRYRLTDTTEAGARRVSPTEPDVRLDYQSEIERSRAEFEASKQRLRELAARNRQERIAARAERLRQKESGS